MKTVGIIGAGIAGLTAAFQLQQQGVDVEVFEAADRTGGVIRSEWQNGYLVEYGPNLLHPRPRILAETISELNLTDQIAPTNESASARYVVRNGSPAPLPQSLWSLLTTNLFSPKGKLRLLAEPFVGTNGSEDESVASFARRRLGPESLDYAVNPVVAGTFAGDPEHLSMRHAFESLYAREQEYGSLLGGALFPSSKRSNGAERSTLPVGPFSFRDGLERLPRALTTALGPCVKCNAPITAIEPDRENCRLTICLDGTTITRSFDAVICTVPLHQITALRIDTPIECAPLEEVPYPPVSILNLGFKRQDVDHPLDGFGFLVPEAENEFDVLGTIFSSSLFPNRAPDGHALLTTFVGGMRNAPLGTKSGSELLPLVKDDLDVLLGLRGNPTFVHHTTFSHALPQYTLSHGEVQDTLESLETEHPGLFFAGNYRDGISVGSAMASGSEAARRAAG